MKRTFLIDTDTASDDAVALIMALQHPEVEVAAITTVAGNVGVRQATWNALYTAEMCGSGVPVYTGAEKPLKRKHQSADWFHGRDGLGDHGYPAPRRSPEKMGAAEAIVELIEGHPGIVMVTLGPLTNVALALQKKPEIAKSVSRCVVMGGAPCCEGNVTPAAEYNIWVRSGSGAGGGEERAAGGDGGLAFVPGRGGAEFERDRKGDGVRDGGGEVCDGVQQPGAGSILIGTWRRRAN